MSLLVQLVNASSSLCQDPAKSRKRILQSIAELMADPTITADSLFEGLMGRERLGSTGLGEGVAIPHCRVACDQMKVALVSLADPIDYEAIDGEPVDLLCALVVPEDENRAHLDALAELSTVFSVPANRNRLRGCGDPESLAAAMRQCLDDAAAQPSKIA